jgi:hypothetical protein
MEKAMTDQQLGQIILDGDPDWDWRAAIQQACAGQEGWQAHKFISKLDEHAARHPAFKPERVAAIFLRASPKVRGWYCYQPISMHTQSIARQRSWQSFARSMD